MKYESKKTVASIEEPGVTMTIKMLGAAARAQLEIATSEARARSRDVALEWAETNEEMLAILPEVKYSPDTTPEQVVLAEQARRDALSTEQKAKYNRLLSKRNFLHDEYSKLEIGQLAPTWIRAGLIKLEGIEGASGKPMTADELIDFGPQELMQEVYTEIYQSTNLSKDRAKNSPSPSSSGEVEGGETKTTTAPSVSEPSVTA